LTIKQYTQLSWEADSHSGSQEIVYFVYRNLPLDSSHLHTQAPFLYYSVYLHFISKVVSSCQISDKNFVDISYLSHSIVYDVIYYTAASNLFFFYFQAEECEESYVAVREYQYPVYVDNRTNEEKILHEAEYYIHMLANNEEYWSDRSIQIPLKHIMPYVPVSNSLSELR